MQHWPATLTVRDFAIIGGMSAVHQFCKIGQHSMVGGASGVAQDVPPFVIAQGNHAKPYGVNFGRFEASWFREKRKSMRIRRVLINHFTVIRIR